MGEQVIKSSNQFDSHLIFDEKQAAAFLNVSVQTLRNWRCARKGPPYSKFGSRVLYLCPDLWEYVKKHRIDPEVAA